MKCLTGVIHRLPAAFHLPMPGVSLFVMAGMNSHSVICRVINKDMKTPGITTTTKKLNRMRLSMILVGIVTALFSLALLYDAQPAKNYGSVNRMISSPKIVGADLSMNIASKVVASALWPF